MEKMYTAIQCTDDRTGIKGSFGFRTGRNTVNGIRFYSLTPVYSSLVDLYYYCKENNIDLRPATEQPETGCITL
jgi:hypothetical protein